MTKLRSLSLSSCLFVALGVVACGPSENADINESVAKSHVEATVSALRGIQGGQDGESVVTALMVLGSSSKALLKPKDGQEKRDGMIETGVARLMEDIKARDAGDCGCSKNKCDFSKCKLGGGAVVEGSLEWGEDFLKCDYKLVGNADVAGVKMKSEFSTFCDLKFSETSLDGKLSSKGYMEVADEADKAKVTWETKLTFNKIKFDESKVLSGSASIEAQVEVPKEEGLYGKSEIEF